ncbi:MAG: hypothetical protein AAGJ94_10765 [Pseudomonadota bacterium]
MFIYCAFDKDQDMPRYAGEALVSATSLRRHTDKPIHLATNNRRFVERHARRPAWPFDNVTMVEGDDAPKTFKVRAIANMDGDCVFLDGDTFIFADLSRVFEFSPFDLAGVREPARNALTSIEAAIEYEASLKYALNSGVLFIRGGFAQTLSERWLAHYLRRLERLGPTAFDQPSLRASLSLLDADVLVLPNNYNFRLQFGGLVAGPVFVVHTHYPHDLAKLIKRDFPAEDVDRLINHVGRINDEFAFETLPPVRGGSLYKLDLKRTGWRGPPLHKRVWRALKDP